MPKPPRDDRKPAEEKLTVICDPSRDWEYRCLGCGQLRFWPSEERPTECGNCGSTKIEVGRPGELPTTAAE